MDISISIGKDLRQNFPVVIRGSRIIDSIKSAVDLGYKVIELHLENIEVEEFIEINKIIENKDLKVSTLGTGLLYVKNRLSFSSKDENIRIAAVKQIKKFIDVAKYWNCKVIIGSVRGKIEYEEERETYEKNIMNCLLSVIDKAEKEEVFVVLEPLNRYETNFINTVNDGLELLKMISSNFLKLHLDTFHMNIEEDNIKEAILRAGSYVGHFHFADNQRKYPGSGHINFLEIKDAIVNINYDGYIAVECLPIPSPEEAARRSLDFIKSLFL